VQVSQMTYSGPTLDTASGKTEVKKTKTSPAVSGLEYAGTPRNAPCPCGSGKKYKLCHGKDAG
jgi:preprotein translocase subunit SecA